MFRENISMLGSTSLGLIAIFCTLFVASASHARSEFLRFWHPDPVVQNVEGFLLYRKAPGGSWGAPVSIPIGSLTKDSGGVFQYTVEVADDSIAIFAISAIAEGGSIESARSGELERFPQSPESSSTGAFLGQFKFDGISDEDAGWLNTGESNSMVEDSSLFGIRDQGSDRVMMTNSALSNIHSHLIPENLGAWLNYEYRGRLMRDTATGGIGLTIYSQYPERDAYYRIRSRDGDSFFHMAAHPDGSMSLSCLSSSTSVSPSSNVWYRFRIQALTDDTAGAVTIKAKVWPDGSAEPGAWEIDCRHTEAEQLRFGTVGVWSGGSGGKYWDDLEVESLGQVGDGPLAPAAPPDPPVLISVEPLN